MTVLELLRRRMVLPCRNSSRIQVPESVKNYNCSDISDDRTFRACTFVGEFLVLWGNYRPLSGDQLWLGIWSWSLFATKSQTRPIQMHHTSHLHGNWHSAAPRYFGWILDSHQLHWSLKLYINQAFQKRGHSYNSTSRLVLGKVDTLNRRRRHCWTQRWSDSRQGTDLILKHKVCC